MNFTQEKKEWFGNIRSDILAGLVSSFAVIPEVVGFCIVAGISPMMPATMLPFGSLCSWPSLAVAQP